MPLPKLPNKHLLWILPALMFIAGCQSQPKSPPPPLATPTMLTQLNHYTGTPLTGPRLAVADVGVPADDFNVAVKWIAVRLAPPRVQQTLASQCRLIIAGQSGAPMLASPDLTTHVLFDQSNNVAILESQFSGPATVDFAPIANYDAALPPKVTAVFSAQTTIGTPRNRVVLRVARPSTPMAAPSGQNADQPLEVTLELAQDNSTTTQPSVGKSETAVFDRPLVSGSDQFAIVIPMHFGDSPAQALLALVNVSPTTTATMLARCHADLQASAEFAAKQPTTASVEGAVWAGYDSALKALWEPANRRAALVFLSSQTAAHICEDTALVADDAILEKLANNIAQQAATSADPHTTSALSWILDRAAFNLLVLGDAPGNGSPQGPAAAPLPPELRAVLTVYAGEPARHPGSLDDIAHQAKGRQDLENRLTAENLVFLTDASPASRVRAFDWLKARGLAPTGFDPLGPGKQRREALDKALASGSN
jgi:hypothetical protein